HAQRANGQSDPSLLAQSGMATREDQLEPVVGNRIHVITRLVTRLAGLPQAHLFGRRPFEVLSFLGKPAFSTEAVDGLVPRGRGDPGARVRRHAVRGPT